RGSPASLIARCALSHQNPRWYLSSDSAHRDGRNGRAGCAPDLERRHDEGELLHVLSYELVELEILQKVHPIHDQARSDAPAACFGDRDWAQLGRASCPSRAARDFVRSAIPPLSRRCPGRTSRTAHCPSRKACPSRYE